MARKSTNSYIAGLPGVQQAVFDAAHEVQAKAKMLSAGHGGLAGDISLDRPNEFDVDVVLNHHNALSIEVGHWDMVYFSGFVPGLHVMRDGARLAR